MPWSSEGRWRSHEGRWDRSLRLTRRSWAIVRRDRALVWLAIAGGLLTLVAAAAIFGLGGFEGDRGQLLLASAVLALPMTFAATFVNVAAAAAADAAFDGRHLSVRRAFAVPTRRVGEVLLWSVLAAGVGVLLQQLAERLPFGGRIVTWLAGLGWAVATYFVVPVLALEGCRGLGCAKRSTRLVRERFGEAVGGFVVVTFWTWVVTVPAGAVLGIGVAMLPWSSAIGGSLVAVGGLALLLVVALGGIVEQVFRVALYRFAVDPSAPVGAYEASDLEAPFKHAPERPRRGDGPEPPSTTPRLPRLS